MPLGLVPLVGVSVIALMTFLYLYAATHEGNNWLEPLLAGLTPRSRALWGIATKIAYYGTFPFSWALVKVYHNVLHAVSVAAVHRMGAVNKWLVANTLRTQMLTRLHVSFFMATAAALERGFGVALPREVGQATRPISRRARLAWRAAAAGAAALAAFRASMNAWRHAHVDPRLRVLNRATTIALPRDIAGVRGRVEDVERTVTRPGTRWLRRIAASMWVVYLAGQMLRVLARRFPWLFCRKVRTVGNRVCGLPDDLLGNLLATTVVLAGSVSLVEFVRDAQAVEDEAIGILRDWIRDS